MAGSLNAGAVGVEIERAVGLNLDDIAVAQGGVGLVTGRQVVVFEREVQAWV